MILWRPIRFSKIDTKKRCPFHHRGLEYKSRKSRNTWSYRQVWPWSTKWSSAKANKFCQENVHHRKHSLSTTQEMILHVDIAGWSTQKSDQLYSWQSKMEKLYTVSKNKTGSWLWLRSWTPYCRIQIWPQLPWISHLTTAWTPRASKLCRLTPAMSQDRK